MPSPKNINGILPKADMHALLAARNLLPRKLITSKAKK
jgi:hypothetical protein